VLIFAVFVLRKTIDRYLNEATGNSDKRQTLAVNEIIANNQITVYRIWLPENSIMNYRSFLHHAVL